MSEPRGLEPGFRRLVVVISSHHFHKSLIQTVICSVITSNLKLESEPGNFKLKKTKQDLNKDSIVHISQLITLDKALLTQKVGQLSSNQVNSLNHGLRLVLNI